MFNFWPFKKNRKFISTRKNQIGRMQAWDKIHHEWVDWEKMTLDEKCQCARDRRLRSLRENVKRKAA